MTAYQIILAEKICFERLWKFIVLWIQWRKQFYENLEDNLAHRISEVRK